MIILYVSPCNRHEYLHVIFTSNKDIKKELVFQPTLSFEDSGKKQKYFNFQMKDKLSDARQ